MSKKLPYVREVFPNGLTMLVYPMKEIEAVGLVLRLHSGHYFEEERGLAHVTEHFLFLGTKSFPTERSVREKFELLGASHNATTGDRDIEVFMHLPKKNVGEGIKLMSELAFTSVLPESSLEKERGVVLQEWHRRHDQPNFRFYRRMVEERFTDTNHPYVRDESKRLLETFTRDDLVKFHQRFFQPQQMILGVGGGVEAKEVLKLVKECFGGVAGSEVITEPTVASDSYASRKTIAHEEKFVQANLELSFPAFGWRERPKEERLAAHMALRILGGSLVSRLWRILREEKGLVYHVGAGLDLMPWLGTTGIELGCGVEKLSEALKIIREEIDRFEDGGPVDAELKLEKEFRLGRLATGFEGSLGTARYFVSEEFDQEGILLLSDRMKMVEKITKEEVKAAAKGLFDLKRVQVGLMNDFQTISKEGFGEMVEKFFGK